MKILSLILCGSSVQAPKLDTKHPVFQGTPRYVYLYDNSFVAQTRDIHRVRLIEDHFLALVESNASAARQSIRLRLPIRLELTTHGKSIQVHELLLTGAAIARYRQPRVT